MSFHRFDPHPATGRILCNELFSVENGIIGTNRFGVIFQMFLLILVVFIRLYSEQIVMNQAIKADVIA
jgi:hypothetical protein